jgi:ABC-type transporter Mla subunit MlaD
MPAQRALYLRVGLLVIAGAALGIGFLVFLAGNNFGNRPVVYETYLRESVQGLDVGAPVKYRGVSLGRVTEIGLVSATYRAPRGEPFAGAFQMVLIRFDVNMTNVGEGAPDLDEAVRQGFRVRLASQGLTGLAYLELDFLAAERFPVQAPPWTPRYPVIPAAPSTVAQVQNAAQMLLQRLEQVDLAGLIDNLSGLLGDLRKETNEGDFSEVLNQAALLLRRLNDSGSSGDLPSAVADIRAVAAEARALLSSRDVRGTLAGANQVMAEVRTAAARLPASLTALENTLRSARGTTGDLQADLGPILRDLRSAVANLRDTTELLRRYPSQAIFGAPPPSGR